MTGLRAEARVAARIGVARAGGGTPEGARIAARALVGEGVTALVSFGLAGGLDPALTAGDLVDPAEIIDGFGALFPTDAGLVTRLRGRRSGRILAMADVVATVRAKATLWSRTNASAVDLESGAVAGVAAEAGLPFAALRAICDSASRDLPAAALVALDARGGIGGWRIARALARRPADLAGLIALARDAARARTALIRRVGQIVDADLARLG